MKEDIKIEFAVQMRDEKCAEIIRNALRGTGQVEIDAREGRVIIETQQPWSLLQDKIENTGRKAVLAGFGGQSAVAIIKNSGTNVDCTPIEGVVRFTAIARKKAGVVVDGVVDGLTAGLHGIHIHETGDISKGCASVGDHYNPSGSPHGSPENDLFERHAGDLGNVLADETGRATFRLVDNILEIGDIIGRSVVITSHADDLGQGKNELSRIDGNSGDKIACGIIARSAGILQNFKKICACDGVTLWDERTKPTLGGNRSQKL